jgi:hypothetical protein
MTKFHCFAFEKKSRTSRSRIEQQIQNNANSAVFGTLKNMIKHFLGHECIFSENTLLFRTLYRFSTLR